MIRIGDFSKLSQVSIKTLRYYDEMGLFKPSNVDRFTGYRYYSASQLPRLNRILAPKDLVSRWNRLPRCWMKASRRSSCVACCDYCTQPVRQDDDSYVTEIQFPVAKREQ